MSQTLFWILLVVVLIVVVLFIRTRNTRTSRTPASLANNVLRYPERMLIDVPLYTPISEDSSSYEFLVNTEKELESIGELESRRQFLLHFAEIVKSPSRSSLQSLTDFMVEDAPELFRETLRWDGRCGAAMNFFQFTHRLLKHTEKGKSLRSFELHSKNRKRHPSEKPAYELQGTDATIMKEWEELNNAIHRAISLLHKDTSNRSASSRNTSLGLGIEDKVPHLRPFLLAARDIYQESFNHQKPKE